jgi:polygalacturonase
VAIVQISRITQRKGLEEDLPQPLAPAELGWAVDTRQLYIGPGTIAEGSPDERNNVEILTEYSDILATQTAYTYTGQTATGYSVQTGPSAGSPVSQSLQSRLDSYCVVSDFGATGNGVTDDTAAINRALYQLYCVQPNPQIRRSLFFPAGSYLITDTILVPPYAMLYGEGPESSILNFFVTAWTSTVAYAAGVLVKSGSSYYRSNFAVPAGTLLTGQVGGKYYWGDESTNAPNGLPSYIMQTASSTQQTGINIVSPDEPQNILISNMNMVTNQIMDGVLVERAHDCSFTNVGIQGPLIKTTLVSATDNVAAVRWASTSALVSNHVTFENCNFGGFTYGTNTQQQIEGITFSNCRFDTLYQGVYLGGATPVNGGPTGVRIITNTFDNIYVQGIVIDGVSLNTTTNNVFYDVGNHFNGAALAASSIIDIDTANNVCLGDMFERTTAQATTYARINLNYTASIAMDNGYRLQQGTYKRESGVRTLLLPGTSPAVTLYTFDATVTPRAVQINYTFISNSGNFVRTGTYTIVSGTTSSGLGLIGSDQSVDNDSNSGIGLTLSVTESSDIVSWKYVTAGGVGGYLYYSVTSLA